MTIGFPKNEEELAQIVLCHEVAMAERGFVVISEACLGFTSSRRTDAWIGENFDWLSEFISDIEPHGLSERYKFLIYGMQYGTFKGDAIYYLINDLYKSAHGQKDDIR